MTLTGSILARSRTIGVVAALLALGACATVPPPTNLMDRAQAQIGAATDAKAAVYAPVDLGFAKTRYKAAQAAMSAQKYQLATDKANEALADARLARTRAQLALLRRQIRSQSTENARLRKQLLSKPAAAASAPVAPVNTRGLPTQIVLPQPDTPAPAATAPARSGAAPVRSPAGGGQ